MKNKNTKPTKVTKPTKKDPEKEILELKENIEKNQKMISNESRNPTGMSYGEMKKLLNGIKVFKSKIKIIERNVKN